MSGKPLGKRAYGSIPHLPTSRLGRGDWHIHEGQAKILTEKPRDTLDHIIVTEKLDGSCVAVARVDGRILALTRSGYLATTTKYEHHHHFAAWVHQHERVLRTALADGERFVGEWLGMAHGTRYDLSPYGPFWPFDLFLPDQDRASARQFDERMVLVYDAGIHAVTVLHEGGPIPVAEALARLDEFGLTCSDEREGVVYRCEREGRVDFLAKYVRPGKIDGCYFTEQTGEPPVWLWRPS